MVISWVREFVRKSSRRVPLAGPARLRLDGLEVRAVPSFFTAPSFAVGAHPAAQAVGDLNGDGRADLVVVNQNAHTVIRP